MRKIQVTRTSQDGERSFSTGKEIGSFRIDMKTPSLFCVSNWNLAIPSRTLHVSIFNWASGYRLHRFFFNSHVKPTFLLLLSLTFPWSWGLRAVLCNCIPFMRIRILWGPESNPGLSKTPPRLRTWTTCIRMQEANWMPIRIQLAGVRGDHGGTVMYFHAVTVRCCSC